MWPVVASQEDRGSEITGLLWFSESQSPSSSHVKWEVVMEMVRCGWDHQSWEYLPIVSQGSGCLLLCNAITKVVCKVKRTTRTENVPVTHKYNWTYTKNF